MGLPKILNPTASKQKIQGRVRTKRAFQQMWVAGSLGAFFIAIARTLPGDIDRLMNPQGDVHLSDLAAVTALRYIYLIWLLWYFFLTNLRREPEETPKVNDISFDVVQSMCALAAAFFLDFIVPSPRHSARMGFIAVNIAIAVISLLSLFWFGVKDKDDKKLNEARVLGAVVAVISLGEVIWLKSTIPDDRGIVAVLATPVLFLYCALAMFHKQRVNAVDPPEKQTGV